MNLNHTNLENKVHPKLRLNAICPYFTMFPLSFPYNILRTAKCSDIVYDPFCGRGTTNYAARLLGIASYGVDSNPVAYAIAQSKLVNVRPADVVSLCGDILLNVEPRFIPEGEFWKWVYHPDTLADICRIREYFLTKPKLKNVEIALRAIVIGALHGPTMQIEPSYLSNQMPRTFSTKPDYSVKFWKKNLMRPYYVSLIELVMRKAQYVFNNQLPAKAGGKIILGDSRNIEAKFEKKFDWVITSPPYYGMSTYEQDQWLRNWFLGGGEKVDYSYKSQIKHYSEKVFIKDLSSVWKNAAKQSNPNAKLVIRFGALPSKSEKTPSELIKDSLRLSDCGWKLRTIKKAGKPGESKRQANQFKNTTGGYVEEIDVYATLTI